MQIRQPSRIREPRRGRPPQPAASTGVAGFGRAVALTCTALLGAALPAHADGCSVGYRELAGIQGLPQVRAHTCNLTAGNAAQSLRVTFARLDEVLAANLVLGERTPEIDQLFKDARLLENDVSATLKGLFERFAHKTVVPARNVSLQVTVSSPGRGETAEAKSADLPSLNAAENETRRLWSISSERPTFNKLAAFDITMSNAVKTIVATTGWPDGYKQFYTCQNDAIFCTKLWRYVAALSEFDAFERDTDATVAAADAKLPRQEREERARKDRSDWEGESDRVYKTHFALFRQLGANGWPSNFLLVQGGALFCGWDFEFQYLMPPLALDVAILENPSPQPIRIDDLFGAMDNKNDLRLAADARAAMSAPAPLGMPALTIPARGAMIVPLRIILLSGLTNPAVWGSMADARKMYGRISTKPGNSIFSFTGRRGEGQKAPIVFDYKKAKASFRAPELPESAEYRFGPQLSLSGFVIEKHDFAVDQKELNLVTLNAAAGGDAQVMAVPEAGVELRLHQNQNTEGSCPILYTWDGSRGEWVNRGKVIHTAHGEENETTSVLKVAPDMRRFRLAEEELEATFLRRLQLILTLNDGRRVAVDPDAADAPSLPATIPAYSKADFNFSVPKEYETTGIATAEIAITGYYDRYSSPLMARLRSVGPQR